MRGAALLRPPSCSPLLREAHGSDASLLRQTPTVRFDALDLVKRLRRHVALTAIRASDDGDVFNDEKGWPLPKGPRESPVKHTRLPTYCAHFLRFLCHVHSTYTVKMTTWPVGPSFATTTIESSPSSVRPRITYFRSPQGRSNCRSVTRPERIALSTSRIDRPSLSISSQACTVITYRRLRTLARTLWSTRSNTHGLYAEENRTLTEFGRYSLATQQIESASRGRLLPGRALCRPLYGPSSVFTMNWRGTGAHRCA